LAASDTGILACLRLIRYIVRLRCEALGPARVVKSPHRRNQEKERVAGKIVALVDDLFFLAKIQETAKAIGVTLLKVDPRLGPCSIAEAQPLAIILDLGSRSLPVLDWIRSLKAEDGTKSIRIVGFVSHVEGQLIADAKSAGCDAVMARSAFTQQLPNLLRSFAAESK
jgi:DNA-binding NarL/FixJ family response regulator